MSSAFLGSAGTPGAAELAAGSGGGLAAGSPTAATGATAGAAGRIAGAAAGPAAAGPAAAEPAVVGLGALHRSRPTAPRRRSSRPSSGRPGGSRSSRAGTRRAPRRPAVEPHSMTRSQPSPLAGAAGASAAAEDCGMAGGDVPAEAASRVPAADVPGVADGPRGRRPGCGGGRARRGCLRLRDRCVRRRQRGRAARGRVGPAVVAAVDRDRRFPATARSALSGRSTPLPQSGQVEREARRGQPAESVLKARDAVLSPAVEVDSHVIALAEDLADQAGQRRARRRPRRRS